MLNLIGSLIKLILFSTFVLVLGNIIHWKGHTLSDQVRMQMAHPERSEIATSIKGWAERLKLDVKKGTTKRGPHGTDEDFPTSSEKQKLNALILELKKPHKTKTIEE